MFSITGLIAGKEVTLTWEDGKISYPRPSLKIVIESTLREGPVAVTGQGPFLEPSLTEFPNVYYTLMRVFDEIISTSGQKPDPSLTAVPPGATP